MTLRVQRRIMALVMIMACAFSLFANTPLPPDSTLRRMAAKMLMVGFTGNTVDASSDAARYVRDLHVGAIILFDVDLTGKATVGSRNVTGRQQLKQLTSQLRQWADYPLLIALDQEGGRVARLKTQYGFQSTVSAEHLGQINLEDSTRWYASRIASDLISSGVNVNLAPVVDILNPNGPGLGKIQRCFSLSPDVIARHAGWFIDEHHKQGVLCTLKHFPGHGNALGDSHWGFVDVTKTWSEQELIPYRTLIDQNQVDLIMTAHIVNRNLDPDLPATLSRKILTDLLRDKMHYNGVVLTDDMYMEAILNNYDIEQAVVMAINAGADMLCAGNNISTGFEADRPFKLVDIIVRAVKDGRIPFERIEQASRRIDALSHKNARDF